MTTGDSKTSSKGSSNSDDDSVGSNSDSDTVAHHLQGSAVDVLIQM